MKLATQSSLVLGLAALNTTTMAAAAAAAPPPSASGEPARVPRLAPFRFILPRLPDSENATTVCCDIFYTACSGQSCSSPTDCTDSMVSTWYTINDFGLRRHF